MAFLSKVGNLMKQTASRQINGDLSAAKPFIYQALRFMSSSKLFVGGLSYGTDQQGLTEAFSKYGEVIEARVIMDRETGRSRGFGFVTYVSTEEASSAIQALDGQDLHGRSVRVNYATDRQPRFQSSYGGGGYGYGGGNESGGHSGGGGGYSGGGENYNSPGSYGGGGGENYNSPSYGGGGGGYGGENYNSPASYGGGSSAGGYGVDTGYGSASNSGFGGNYNSVAGGAGGGDNFTGASNFSGSGIGFGAGEQQFDHSAGGNLNHNAGGYRQDISFDGNYKDDDEPGNYAKRA